MQTVYAVACTWDVLGSYKCVEDEPNPTSSIYSKYDREIIMDHFLSSEIDLVEETQVKVRAGETHI